MKAGCLFGNAVISFNVGGTTWVGRRHHVGSSKVGSCEFSLAGKTCCAFDCYTCGRLGGVDKKERQEATLRNYMQRRCDLHNNLDIVLVLNYAKTR